MSLGSTTAKQMDLSACYGSAHSSVWPAVVYLTLWNGNPGAATPGVELTLGVGNYARLAINNDDTQFLISGTTIVNAVDWAFTTASGNYSASYNYWAFMTLATGGVVLDCGPVTESDGVTLKTVTVEGGDQVIFPAGGLVIGA